MAENIDGLWNEQCVKLEISFLVNAITKFPPNYWSSMRWGKKWMQTGDKHAYFYY